MELEIQCGGQLSNPGEMMVAWTMVMAKKVEADGFEICFGMPLGKTCLWIGS